MTEPHFSGYEVVDCDRKQEALDAFDTIVKQLKWCYADDMVTKELKTIRKYIEESK
jgi:hypothetical protein